METKLPKHHEMHGEHGTSALPKEFLSEIDSLGTLEAKVDRTLSFMQELLETGDAHQIRLFWEARRLCLECFYGQIDPLARVSLWSRYSDLCREARGLKEIFEEQSSFLSEQIEKAIDAYEEELATPSESIGKPPSLALSRATALHGTEYSSLQHELNYLNGMATKISHLRKELLKAEIKYKQKSRLLERLRHLGDQVFPKRKQRMQEVSTLFTGDVEGFIQSTFVDELNVKDLLAVREEIKLLQGMAKLLTLSTDAFTKTRLQLSDCWVNMRSAFKEQKKIFAEQKMACRKHSEELLATIEVLEKALEQKNLTSAEARKQAHQISSTMHTVSLIHHDVRMLRERLQEVYRLIDQLAETETKLITVHERKHGQLRVKDILDRIGLLEENKKASPENEETLRLILHDLDGVALTRDERLTVDREVTKIRRAFEAEYEQRALALATLDEKDEEMVSEVVLALEHLCSDMEHVLESWKRARACSGNDFAQAMEYTDLIGEERRHIDRVEQLIERLTSA